MIGLDAGGAWASVAACRGRVQAVFSRAVHLQLGRPEPLVVVDGRSWRGPMHLRVDVLPSVNVGDEVVVAGGRLQLGAGRIDLGSLPAWTPPEVHGRPRVRQLRGVERSAVPDGMLDDVRRLLVDDDLVGVADVLGGWGPGLTPAGDDVLAGIVLTLHVFGHARDRLPAVVDRVRSTDLARGYLRWAARGQCIEPAHSVLAAVTGDDDAELQSASARLCAHGASSGADLLRGIECALAATVVRTVAAPTTPL
jgi:Protein of unknown function (DUF2877)